MTDLPNSPIAGGNGPNDIPTEVGYLETRRARANIEIVYRAKPGEFVDIQQAIFDALAQVGQDHIHRDLGTVLQTVDLTEHIVLG